MTEKNITYRIAQDVFDKFPGYVRGVVLAYGVKNGQSPDDLIALLRSTEDDVRGKLDAPNLAQHPQMAAWREAYRAFGAKPAKFRPSMEAMARRILKNQALPSISRLVDLGNVVSLRYLMPAGGHAIDVVKNDIMLRPATGRETFVPFGSDKPENPEPGEIIFAEADTVLTRRWTWRQANHTLVMEDTTAIEFNVDGLPPVSPADVKAACEDVMELVRRFCGGRVRYELLTPENPAIALAESSV